MIPVQIHHPQNSSELNSSRKPCSRTRGATPPTPRPSEPPSFLLPHTRGYTGGGAHRCWQVLALAQAGLHRRESRARAPRGPCSRTRGATPPVAACSSNRSSLLPHTRGYTGHLGSGRKAVILAPAHAVLHRHRAFSCRHGAPCSRTRGATPRGPGMKVTNRTLLPHTRGYTGGHAKPSERQALAPAHAGLHRLRARDHHGRAACSRTRRAIPRPGR